MLSPVRTVRTTDATYTPEPARAGATVAESDMSPTPAPSVDDAPISSATITAKAMSGEVHLSQTANVLLETLGKLLAVPREDGEGPGAYGNRLMAALQALPKDRLAALETHLGTLVKGLTVAILLETLQSASGPEAARLALTIELTLNRRSGDGAKTTLPSYLQDIIPPAPPSAAEPQRQGLARASSRPINPLETSPSANRPMANGPFSPLVRPDLPQDASSKSGAGVPPRAGISNTSGQPIGRVTNVPTGAPPADQLNVVADASKVITAEPLPKAGSKDVSASLPNTQIIATAAKLEPTQAPLRPAIAASAQNEEDIASPPRPISDPAIATASVPAVSSNLLAQIQKAPAQAVEKLLLAALFGSVSGASETASGPSSSATSASLSRSLPEPPANSGPATAPATTPPNGRSSDVLAASSSAGQAGAVVSGHERVPERAAAAIEQQPLFHAAAAVVIKDGIALPFIPYSNPTEDREEDKDQENRHQNPSQDEPGMQGKEGEGEKASDQADEDALPDGPELEERVAANDETQDQSLSQGEHADGRRGDAQSYYLRMSS